MTAQEIFNWIKENAYKFEPHEGARSNGMMWVLTEALITELEKLLKSQNIPSED